MPPVNPFIFILSAPSGAGKSTILQRVLKMGLDLVALVSVTTRAPRFGERDGVDYYFETREGFKRMVAGRQFLEWAEIHGNLYGITHNEVARRSAKGESLILDIDCQGFDQLRAVYGERVVGILLLPPSPQEHYRRMMLNAPDADERERRIRTALQEFHRAEDFHFHVVKEDLETAVGDVAQIIETKKLGLKPVGNFYHPELVEELVAGLEEKRSVMMPVQKRAEPEPRPYAR